MCQYLWLVFVDWARGVAKAHQAKNATANERIRQHSQVVKTNAQKVAEWK